MPSLPAFRTRSCRRSGRRAEARTGSQPWICRAWPGVTVRHSASGLRCFYGHSGAARLRCRGRSGAGSVGRFSGSWRACSARAVAGRTTPVDAAGARRGLVRAVGPIVAACVASLRIRLVPQLLKLSLSLIYPGGPRMVTERKDAHR
jgi:hypothetical protein